MQLMTCQQRRSDFVSKMHTLYPSLVLAYCRTKNDVSIWLGTLGNAVDGDY